MTSGRARGVALINSGAYAHQELSGEFGSLPPAFLPVGLGRLYELQARMFESAEVDLHLTLPESFALPAWDERRLDALGFRVLRTPDGLSLGAALLNALGRLGFSDRQLRVLHGDTLLAGADLTQDDVIAVAEGEDGYRWAEVSLADDGRVRQVSRPDRTDDEVQGTRLCGYFAFSSVGRFAERLALAQGDIYDALNAQAHAGDLGVMTPGAWLDFGHVQTYFRSRRIVTTERAFNSLEVTDLYVRKRSATAADKLRAEARWLSEAPPCMTPYTARVIHQGEDARGYHYDTGYEYMPTLAELHVFGDLGRSAWSRVLDSCGRFLDSARSAGEGEPIDGLLTRLVVDKTHERLERHAFAAGLDLDAPTTLDGRPAPSLRACLRDVEAALAGCGDRPSVMHGDFCFSNILFSFRTDRICVIDPRGVSETGEFSLYGDLRYDLAKLMHSICGLYDLIIAGQAESSVENGCDYRLSFPHTPARARLETLAGARVMGGVSLHDPVVWATMISLFLSMPPLHADRPDRQTAFLANALRLHRERLS